MMHNVVIVARTNLDCMVSDHTLASLKAQWRLIKERGQAVEPGGGIYEFRDQRGALHALDLAAVEAISAYPIKDEQSP